MTTELTERQEQLLEMIKKKKECDKRAHSIVLSLIEPNVKKEELLDQAKYIGLQHYDDVVEERRVGGHCGWALCDKALEPSKISKQTWIIRGKKVLDITERKAYCSSNCYAKSAHFRKQILITPLWMRGEEDDETTFTVLEDETELHGVIVDVTGLSLSDDEETEEKEQASSF